VVVFSQIYLSASLTLATLSRRVCLPKSRPPEPPPNTTTYAYNYTYTYTSPTSLSRYYNMVAAMDTDLDASYEMKDVSETLR
jgi:hypothetical protein